MTQIEVTHGHVVISLEYFVRRITNKCIHENTIIIKGIPH